MIRIYFLVFCLMAVFSFSCSTNRFVEPLDKGELEIGGNGGGPLLNFGGSSIPLPLSSVYAGYGYSDDLTLYGGLHITSLAFKTLKLEAGTRKKLVVGHSIYPSVSGALAVNGIVSLRDGATRVFPEIALNPYWRYGRWKTYTGLQAWFDFYKFSTQNYGYGGFFVPAISVGQTVDLADWEIGIEYKRLAFNVPSENSVVDYIVPSGIGAHGIYLNASRSFGYKAKTKIDE